MNELSNVHSLFQHNFMIFSKGVYYGIISVSVVGMLLISGNFVGNLSFKNERTPFLPT
jgi:hypothetical protein